MRMRLVFLGEVDMRISGAKSIHERPEIVKENTNGLLRQFFPKGSDFKKFNQKELDAAVELLNHRPRKDLGYRTPYEVFFGHLPPTEDIALQN